MKVQQSNIHYINPVTQQEMKNPGYWWKAAVPYILGTALLKGLSEAAVSIPADQVISLVSKGLNYSIPLCVLVGAYKMWKGYESQELYKEARKTEYIRIPKAELEAIQEELSRMKQMYASSQ